MDQLKVKFVEKLKRGIPFPHHECGACRYMVKYLSDGERLFFDSGCNCGFGSFTRRVCSWGDIDTLFEPERGWIPKIEKFVNEN